MARAFSPPDNCPVCGESVPRTARACPGCGADERSGWNEEAVRYDALDLPDEAAGPGKTPTIFWPLVVGAGLVVILVYTLILR